MKRSFPAVALLGAVVEAVAEQPFAAFLGDEVLGPAGCTTLRVDDSYAIIPHRAQGYRRSGAALANAHPVDTSNKIPGGAQQRVSTLLFIDRDTGVCVGLMANLEGIGKPLGALARALAALAAD